MRGQNLSTSRISDESTCPFVKTSKNDPDVAVAGMAMVIIRFARKRSRSTRRIRFQPCSDRHPPTRSSRPAPCVLPALLLVPRSVRLRVSSPDVVVGGDSCRCRCSSAPWPCSCSSPPHFEPSCSQCTRSRDRGS